MSRLWRCDKMETKLEGKGRWRCPQHHGERGRRRGGSTLGRNPSWGGNHVGDPMLTTRAQDKGLGKRQGQKVKERT